MRHLNPNCSKKASSPSLSTPTRCHWPRQRVPLPTSPRCPHLCSATPPRDWLPATLIDAGGSSSLSAAQPPCFHSCTGTQLQEINADAAPATHRERRHRRDRRASPTAPISPSARGFFSRSKLRAFIRCQPVAIASRRTASPPPSRETSAPLMRTGGASSPLICEVEQRPTAIMLVSETRAAVVKAPTRRRRVIGED